MTAGPAQQPASDRADSRIVVEHAQPQPRGRRSLAAPLLAVCGLCGGAGTSTLSYLVARFAVTCGRGHVLVCDTGGPAGGLAACTTVESAWSLTEASDRLADDLPLAGRPYAVDDVAGAVGGELRVIASGPRFSSLGDANAIEALFAMARDDGAHALTVVDCGTLQRAADRIALRCASHVAWVLPATPSGVRRGERVLAQIRPRRTHREVLVARRDARRATAGLRALKALARQRNAPLVLMPEVPDVLEDAPRALEQAQVTLQAILGVLER
jgi:MinD-like ATPase involved in chromosome partitioning or flagellar assembly